MLHTLPPRSRSDPAGTVRTLDGSGLADIFSAHAMRLSCVVNGATFGAFVSTPLLLDRYDGSKDAGILAPGEIVSIFGGGLGPNAGASAAPVTPLPAQLAGVRVLFNGIPAPFFTFRIAKSTLWSHTESRGRTPRAWSWSTTARRARRLRFSSTKARRARSPNRRV